MALSFTILLKVVEVMWVEGIVVWVEIGSVMAVMVVWGVLDVVGIVGVGCVDSRRLCGGCGESWGWHSGGGFG